MAFYVGQKVVCVDAVADGRYLAGHLSSGNLHGLMRDSVYTVRAVGQGCYGNPMIWLCEITRPDTIYSDGWSGEPGYHPARFRPVVERKTDISIFTAMLNPSDERVDAS